VIYSKNWPTVGLLTFGVLSTGSALPSIEVQFMTLVVPDSLSLRGSAESTVF
jgi:hypothetical protein